MKGLLFKVDSVVGVAGVQELQECRSCRSAGVAEVQECRSAEVQEYRSADPAIKGYSQKSETKNQIVMLSSRFSVYLCNQLLSTEQN